VVFGFLLCLSISAMAGDLTDILERKGVLTEEEAAEIKKQDKEFELPKGLKGVKVGALWYLDYSNGQEPVSGDASSSYNEFRVTRGYLTVKKGLLPWFHTRITIDTHQDDTGDYKMRLKYLYAELRPPDAGLFTDMKSEIGLGHIPWLDLEEHINPYRCQGTMAIERAGVFNSADAGVSLRGYLGGQLEDAEEKTGNHYYNGRYGSWHVGIYNGPGYHESEKNNNKVLEGRLSLRPLPDVIPGLQLSYFGLYGEGNDEDNPAGEWPDYAVNLGMLSYENPWVTVTGQYLTTQGNAKGTWVDASGDALETAGYSFFGNLKLSVLDGKLSLFARYDHFDQDTDEKIGNQADYDLYVGGLAYDIYKGNLFLLAYETTDYGSDAGKKGKVPVANNRLGDDHKVQAVLQIKF
ncbi:MAG: hypothetical protein JSV01_07195, partial [Desulfobacterales bacterium]